MPINADSHNRQGRDRRLPRGLGAGLTAALSALGVAALGVAFWSRAFNNLTHVDIRNSNFFVFWLAGRMAWTGDSPYDPVKWAAGQDAYGVTWRPNTTFLYPLPMQFLAAPLGRLSLPAAYFTWVLVSEVLVGAAVWSLLCLAGKGPHRLLFFPMVLGLMFFGPVFLTLQVGAMGALSLIIVVAAIALLDRKAMFAAGLLLSFLLLKPSQGGPILLLAAAWIGARREWKAMAGMATGAIGLFVIGMLGDPLWITRFRASSETIAVESLGLQSNVFGFSYAVCNRNASCGWLLGAILALCVLVAGVLLLWRRRGVFAPWQAINLIIPLGFVAAPYVWSYDQILYVIPAVWITVALLSRWHSYLPPIAFLVILIGVSFFALLQQAYTHEDLASAATTLLVLGCLAWLMPRSAAPQGA